MYFNFKKCVQKAKKSLAVAIPHHTGSGSEVLPVLDSGCQESRNKPCGAPG
jgi:hypothetical protein